MNTMNTMNVMEGIRDAGNVIIEIIKAITEGILEALKAIKKRFDGFVNYLLWAVSTKKEWRIYRHTKKKRTREKYRKLLMRRLLAAFKDS